MSNSLSPDGLTVNAINGGQIGGNRNLIINGAMQVAQRGTVTGVSSSSYGGPDRLRLGNASSGTHTLSQSTEAPSGFAYSFKVDCTTAQASPTQLSVQHKIEGQDVQHLKKGSASAESVTISFWVRSNVTGTYVLEIQDADNARHIASTYSISSANTWEQKTITFAGDTSGALDNDNGNSFQLNWWIGASTTYTSGTLATSWASLVDGNRAAGLTANIASSTSNEWYITGVQLEVGEVATPFEHRSLGDELARCQRYYQAHGNGASGLSFSINDMPASIATDTVNITGKFFVKMMRAAPTMVIYSRNSTANKVSLVATGADYATATFAPNVIGVTGFHLVSRSGGSNLTKGDGYEYGYTADAEL